MSNSIPQIPEILANLLGGKKETGNSLQNLMQKKLDADNLAKGIYAQSEQQPGALQDQFQPSAKGLQAASMVSRFEQGYAYSETTSLTLTTKEGDKVTLDFRQIYAQYQQQKTEQSAENGPQGVRYFESKESMEATSFEEHFAFSVEGDLNDDELKAIFNVFEQVDELAGNFFNGNIEKAFQQAVELDVDFSQLQSVDLNLQQTETFAQSSQQVAAYQGVENSQPETAEQGGTLADLPPYLQKMQEVISQLDEQFEEARSIMEEFMASMTAARYPDEGNAPTWLDRVRELHDQLFEKANLDPETAKPLTVDSTAKTVEPAEAVEPVGGKDTIESTAEIK